MRPALHPFRRQEKAAIVLTPFYVSAPPDRSSALKKRNLPRNLENPQEPALAQPRTACGERGWEAALALH
jgi:hypothetical protein